MPGSDGPAHTGGTPGRHALLLGILRSLLTAAGVLTDDEFSQEKSRLLGV